ncbi:MAG: PD-(D/E)XK nuclease family protein [Candidatus Hodarchaeales archaeon]
MSTLIKTIQKHWTNETNNYKVERNQFRISQAIYCSQRIFFSKLFEMPEVQKEVPQIIIEFQPDLRLQGIFAAGNAAHEYIENILPETYLVASEGIVKTEYENIQIIGHYDLLVIDPDHGLKIVDIKTCNSKAYSYKANKPDDLHLRQANLYGHILKTSHFSILYINKEDYNMTEHTRLVNHVKAESELIRLNRIYNKIMEFIKNGKHFTVNGNEITADGEPWECRYCPYRDICKQ